MAEKGRSPSACVGAFCFRDGALLLIRRATPPNIGAWSVPGGRIEWGETAAAAVLRELREETGVEGEILGFIENYELLTPEVHFLIAEFALRWTAGEPRPSEEASEAVFAPLDQLESYGLTADLKRVAHAAARLARGA